MVNEALVRRFFPGQDPLGRRITFGNPANPRTTWAEIVGVVGDMRRSGLDKEPRAEVYFYQGQLPDNGLFLALRADGDLFAVARAAQKAVWAIDPDQPIASMRPLEDLLRGTVAERRLSMGLLAAFGALALLLATIGIYGVMAFSTAQRTRELGIRLALGAEPRDVLRLILRDGARLSAVGVGLGVVGRAGREPRGLEHALRHQSHRPADLRGGRGRAGKRLASRLLRSRAARDPRRPGGGPAAGLSRAPTPWSGRTR